MRGSLVSLNQLMITVGIMVSYGVGYAIAATHNWRWMLGLGTVPAATLSVGMLFLPESPRWLVGHRRLDEAREILRRAPGPNADVDEEIDFIQELHRAEEHASYADLLKPNLRPALIVGVGTALINELVGVNAVVYYAPTLPSDAGFGDSASVLATWGIGAVNVMLTIVALLLIDPIGRRRSC